MLTFGVESAAKCALPHEEEGTVRSQPEIIFSTDTDRAALSRSTARGRLIRLARGIYTSSIDTPAETVVARNLWQIIGREFPGAVVVDRSARHAGPVGGRLTIDHPRRRPVELPGVVVVPADRFGPVDGDMSVPGGLWMSSVPRQLLDNLDRSRGWRSRVMTDDEIEAWIDAIVAEKGPEGLNKIRDEARRIAPALNRGNQFARLERIIGATLGTADITAVRSPRLLSRASGQPFDARRVDLFDSLADHLMSHAPTVMPLNGGDAIRRRLLPFYEAYFSNYIEGTEFTLDEAAALVFDKVIPDGRPADAHDVRGTFDLVADGSEMRRQPSDSEELVDLLLKRHLVLMGGRPEAHPGRFKSRANRAGLTEFVAPDLVVGTLRRGFDSSRKVVSPFARAVFMMFLVAEVHPFTDGNGRLARIFMNAELVAADEARIIIPTVLRNDYLMALRGATHNGNFAALFAVLDFARRWTAQVDFTSRTVAEQVLADTNALRDANEAERLGTRLILPSAAARRGY